MKAKNVALLFIMLLTVGCATIKPVVVDQTGREMPDPHYVLQAVGQPLRAVFYYTAYEELTDVDGTVIAVPKYLDFLTTHDIFAENIKTLTLTIEILNPNRIEYLLYQQTKIEGRKLGDERQIGGPIYKSVLEHRQFVYNLPIEKDVRDVDQYVSLSINDDEIMRFGHFQYHLIH